MQAKLDRISNRTTQVVVNGEVEVDDDGNEIIPKVPDPPKETLAAIEQYQNQINQIAEERESVLTNLVALMSVNPAYADVEDVCSRQRFDDIFETAAMEIVEKEGGDPTPTAVYVLGKV